MVSFISIAFVVARFVYQISIHAGLIFEGFLGPHYVKYGPILLKFSPEVVF